MTSVPLPWARREISTFSSRTPIVARCGTGHGSGLGRQRSVVERSFAWLHAFKRLRTRYERTDIHQAPAEPGLGRNLPPDTPELKVKRSPNTVEPPRMG